MEIAELTALLRRHAGLIHKIAHAYCRDATDREDVVQEIAIQLWRSREQYDPQFRETTWIYRIALNVAISFYRRERRHARTESMESIDSVAPTVGPAAISSDAQLLLRFVDELGPLDKALVLLYLDGNDHAAIADVLGISVSNVGTKLGRIKDKLRAAFEATAKQGATHGAR
jgi:RNA polymerase sigma-70 factor (ECF subfamily)